MLRRLRDSQCGATAVEFALGLPIVLGLTMGSIEVGYSVYAHSVLVGAVRDTARAGLTGHGTREERIGDRITKMMRSFPKTSSSPVTVESRVYASFDDVDKPEPFVDGNANTRCDNSETYQDINGNGRWDADMARAGRGGPGEVVVYTINYPLRPLFGFLGVIADDKKTVNLQAITLIRNEPFGAPTNPTVSSRTC